MTYYFFNDVDGLKEAVGHVRVSVTKMKCNVRDMFKEDKEIFKDFLKVIDRA